MEVSEKAAQLLALFRAAGEHVTQSSSSLEWLFHVDGAFDFVSALADMGRDPAAHLRGRMGRPLAVPSHSDPPQDDHEVAQLEAEILALRQRKEKLRKHASSLRLVVQRRELALEARAEVEAADHVRAVDATQTYCTPHFNHHAELLDQTLREISSHDAADPRDLADLPSDDPVRHHVHQMEDHLRDLREKSMEDMSRTATSPEQSTTGAANTAMKSAEIRRLIVACGMAEEVRVVEALGFQSREQENLSPVQLRSRMDDLRSSAQYLGEKRASLEVELELRYQKTARQERQRKVQKTWSTAIQQVDLRVKRLDGRLAEREGAVGKMSALLEASGQLKMSDATQTFVNRPFDFPGETPKETYLRVLEGMLSAEGPPGGLDMPSFADLRNIYSALDRVDKRVFEVVSLTERSLSHMTDKLLPDLCTTLEDIKELRIASCTTPHEVLDGLRESEVILKRLNETVAQIGKKKQALDKTFDNDPLERARRSTWASLFVAPESLQKYIRI